MQCSSFFFWVNSYPQSDVQNLIKGWELVINGLSIFKSGKSVSKSANSKIIESICVKNKLTDKITFKIVGKDEEANDVKMNS